ncbi:trypsin zeta-like [Plodia interpunctella]|uniref:trypsin zeta-like n=1 Tax=Plodia interpunctella TaxID=58824 RepID=UPI00236812EA|nr:trypsin zeta-like [Plodia interpunctella]
MCGRCCRELGRWSRSFTKTETFLTILEAILLILFIAFLTFVVLHFIACNKKEIDESSYLDDEPRSPAPAEGPAPAAPGVKCTWDPKAPTEAVTRYYEDDDAASRALEQQLKGVHLPASTTTLVNFNDILPYLSDGEDAKGYEDHILALVKLRPPQDVTFGCILTIVSDYWAVTAASCIEAIEEVDSLDSFVMMDGYGESRHGRTHAVADVLIHPWYQGSNKSYDFVALKSEDRLVRGSKSAVEFSSLLDHFFTPIGEKLEILGFGGYRAIESGPSGRSLRRVSNYLVSPKQCGAAERWAPRHLLRPHAAPQGSCGTRLLCAGAVSARGAACNYCAGTPLLRAHSLHGIMSDNAACGAACEPALFVNVALLRPWLDALLAGDDDFLA